MKTSSGLLLGVLFTLVVVIVAVVIYFNTRPGEEKTETPTGPSPTLPTIDDLTIAQTLSPDSDSETYTIEPYTIEYAAGDNEKALSKNVKFTLSWKNGNGYNNVQKLKIDHYIVTSTDTTNMNPVKSFSVTRGSADAGNYPGMFENYGSVQYSISGDGSYSFIGKNRFSITAILNYKESDQTENKEVSLYKDFTNESIAELDVSEEDLTATLDMTGSITKTFNLKLQDGSTTGTDNAASSEVKNTKYTFKSYTSGTSGLYQITNIELIPQDEDGIQFKFRKDGKYIKAEIVDNIEVTVPVTPKYAKFAQGDTSNSDAIITFVYNTDKDDEKRLLKTTINGKDYYLFGKARYNKNSNGQYPSQPGPIWKQLSDVTQEYDGTKTWHITTQT